MSQVTVKELDDLLAAMVLKEKEIDALALVMTEHNKEFNRLKFRAVDFLKELGRESYSSPAGDIKMVESWRVNLPQTDLEKAALFGFLKEEGLFEKYATVNANSLNALYKAYWEEAKDRGEGMTFSMPGVGAPKLDRVPKFKANKI